MSIFKSHFLLCIAMMLCFFNCTKIDGDGSSMNSMEEELTEPSTYSYLALGDSYTIGQGVSETGRWPIQLQERLMEDSIIVDSVRIIAQTGWTTTNLLTAIDLADSTQYDIVSLLIGVNNQFQGRPFSLFEEEFNILLDKAEDFCVNGSEGLFVVSIPDYGVTPFGANNALQIAEELDQYNLYTLEQCQARSIPYIDITELSRMLGADNGALAPDNLHPSAYQYSKWVSEILPEILPLFE